MRSYELELLDLGPEHYTLEEYRDCLVKLDRIGRFLGGDRATYWGFQQVNGPIYSILDVGCGGGQFTTRLAKRYPEAKAVGIDLNPDAIAFAKEQQSNAIFEQRSTPELEDAPKSFDVVTCTLVCHHMNDDELVSFLQKACDVARKAVVINDLHRHSFAWLSFKGIAPLLFPNRLVYHDGPLSVKRAFTKEDWKNYLTRAGIPPERYSITWHFAFRWIVVITC